MTVCVSAATMVTTILIHQAFLLQLFHPYLLYYDPDHAHNLDDLQRGRPVEEVAEGDEEELVDGGISYAFLMSAEAATATANTSFLGWWEMRVAFSVW
jgi:hypothetical protein